MNQTQADTIKQTVAALTLWGRPIAGVVIRRVREIAGHIFFTASVSTALPRQAATILGEFFPAHGAAHILNTLIEDTDLQRLDELERLPACGPACRVHCPELAGLYLSEEVGFDSFYTRTVFRRGPCGWETIQVSLISLETRVSGTGFATAADAQASHLKEILSHPFVG